MVVRHHQIDFASGALVFPGGKVDEGDAIEAVRARCDGESREDFVPFEVAAIRESFEECGVLLARDADTGELVSGARAGALEQLRDPLNNGEVTLIDFLEQEDLRLACDCLQHFAHWITPEFMPKRFDTHFFIARVPDHQVPAHDGTESVESVWVNPRRALEEAEDGKWTVIFPTRCNLQMLAQAETVAEAVAQAGARGVIPVLPTIELRDGDQCLCIPEEAGYPVSYERIDPNRLP